MWCLLLCQSHPAACVTVRAPCRRFCKNYVPWGGWCRLKKVSEWSHIDCEKEKVWKYNLLLRSPASLERQEQTASPCQPRLGPGTTPRRRPRKRRPIYKVAPVTVSSARRAALNPLDASPLTAAPADSGKGEESEKDSSTASSHPVPSELSMLPPQSNPVTVNHTQQSPLLNQLREPQSIEVTYMLVYTHSAVLSVLCCLLHSLPKKR